MTSFYSRKEQLIKYKNALNKLEPYQVERKILLFELAARSQFFNSDLVKRIISETGSEKLGEMSLDEFITMSWKWRCKIASTGRANLFQFISIARSESSFLYTSILFCNSLPLIKIIGRLFYSNPSNFCSNFYNFFSIFRHNSRALCQKVSDKANYLMTALTTNLISS